MQRSFNEAMAHMGSLAEGNVVPINQVLGGRAGDAATVEIDAQAA